MKILVVGSPPTKRDALGHALEREGFRVELASSGEEAAGKLGEEDFATVVAVDIRVAEELRKTRVLPMLMVSSGAEVDDVAAGLEADAEDFVVEPFGGRELLARLHALLRRAPPAHLPGDVLRFADLELDTTTRLVRRADVAIELTRTEFELLELFIRNPGRVLTREFIFERVWGYNLEFSSNSLNVYVSWLRRKTEIDRRRPRLIQTVRGIGYVLRV